MSQLAVVMPLLVPCLEWKVYVSASVLDAVVELLRATSVLVVVIFVVAPITSAPPLMDPALVCRPVVVLPPAESPMLVTALDQPICNAA